MSHTFLTCARCVAAQRTLDSIKTTEIAWTRVHAIIKLGTCLKCNFSDGDWKTYLTPRGDMRDVIFINVKTARSRSDGHSEAHFFSLHGDAWSVGFHRTAGRIRGRTPRSRSDRTAIAVRLSRDRGSFIMESIP